MAGLVAHDGADSVCSCFGVERGVSRYSGLHRALVHHAVVKPAMIAYFDHEARMVNSAAASLLSNNIVDPIKVQWLELSNATGDCFFS